MGNIPVLVNSNSDGLLYLLCILLSKLVASIINVYSELFMSLTSTMTTNLKKTFQNKIRQCTFDQTGNFSIHLFTENAYSHTEVFTFNCN